MSPETARSQAYDQLVENGHGPTTLTRRSTGADSLEGDSSPFVNNVDDTNTSQASSNQENYSPSKDKRRSRIMSGSEISPLKMLQQRSHSIDENVATESASAADDKLMPPMPKSPRKSISPMRRFPVRVNTGSEPANPRGGSGGRPQSIPPPVRERDEPRETASTTSSTTSDPDEPRTVERELSLEEAIAQNPGVRHAIEIFEDTLDSMGDDDEYDDHGDNTSLPEGDGTTIKGPMDHHQNNNNNNGVDEEMVDDETMLSTFSTFSAIPNMTTFARLGGRMPNQMAQDARRGSNNNTTNLLDFTDSQRFPGGRSSSPPKSLADAKKTPQRQSIANLLDFEIPPMPTPRSVPSISARELESLKSNFMSEISSLRATLSGKEAEAASLKTALMDAEKRAGESLEQLRDERTMREQYAEEKETWEKRGREMETVLRQVKDEIMTTQREREALEARLEENEGRREAAEMMAQEAESKMAAMRASRVGSNEAANSPGGGIKSPKAPASQREIELAVEKVARELHAAYKSKHESKVAALKKNYENRWDKKIREMEAKIEELTRENEELRVGRDATLTKVEIEAGERREQAGKDAAHIRELQTEVERLDATLKTVQADNSELRKQLEVERVEKGELVTLAEELMQVQSNQSIMVQNNHDDVAQQTNNHLNRPPPQQRRPSTDYTGTTPPRARVPQRASAPVPPRGQTVAGGLSRAATTATPRKTAPSPSGIPGTSKPSTNTFRNSMIGRPPGVSGLKVPGASSSRIGGPPTSSHQRGVSGLPGRPASGLARPGALMNSIQQMGNYRGRGD